MLLLVAPLPIRSGEQAAVRPTLSTADRIRIAEAFRVADLLGDDLWKGWRKTAFALLLVTPEREFLIRHPPPSGGFAPVGFDRLLKSTIFARARTQPLNLLATFPAVSALPTIVVGQAERTEASDSTHWVVTLLHEHFHQFQYTAPNYYRDAERLDLAHGDSSGTWMLNYPFPYDDGRLQEVFAAWGRQLARTVRAVGSASFDKEFRACLTARQVVREAVAEEPYRYLAFQIWQEGVARYTQYRMARLAATRYRATRAFMSLSDYRGFADVAAALRKRMLADLENFSLERRRRIGFYSLGAAEALVLDAARPGWRQRYFDERFDLGRLLDVRK
ncbi:MAG: hypothetical protein HYX76_13800 [Acidobacteria bacterium]|nr:hypothetical protein [Acidobacteriota bacterium]